MCIRDSSLNYVNTVKEEHTESPLLKIDLTVPGLSNTSFPELEKDINNDILHKVNSKIEEVTHESEQYYEALWPLIQKKISSSHLKFW